MTRLFDIPEGCCAAQPYVENRRGVSSDGRSVDFAPIKNLMVWNQAFGLKPDGDALGWSTYWQAAGELLGTGTDFVSDKVGLEIQAFFPDGGMRTVGVRVPIALDDEIEWAAHAVRHLQRCTEGEVPSAGLIGVVLNENHRQVRPCVTMMVTSPGGAEEAVFMMQRRMAELGLNIGVCIRTVRNGAAGVIKLVFMPEFFTRAGGPVSYGIDWKVWLALFKSHPEREWNDVCLFWCDWVAAGVAELREEMPLIVDDVYFDFLRVVPFLSRAMFTSIQQPTQLVQLMRMQPHEFIGDLHDQSLL